MSFQPRMQSALALPKAELEDRFGYANAERMRTRWRAGGRARMQSALALPKAELEDRFGYANAERMRTRWRAGGRVCKAPFSSQRQRLKTALGMLTRSV
jgi:hypothetical protein